MGKFNFNETPGKKVAEEIRDNHSEIDKRLAETNGYGLSNVEAEQVVQNREPQPIPEVNQQMQSLAQPVGAKPKKEKNGIVIDVPMEDYMKLTMMKLQTGRTLKDLALQAIHEFVERNEVG